MAILNNAGIIRGLTLVDHAFSGSGTYLEMTPADQIGLVAAYIGRGLPIIDMIEELSNRLGMEFGDMAATTFGYFHSSRGRGLWEDGPNGEGLRFTHPTLNRAFPNVNKVSGAIVGMR